MNDEDETTEIAPLPDLGLPLDYEGLPPGRDQVTLEGNVSRETKEKA
jgi:hypothetical protein